MVNKEDTHIKLKVAVKKELEKLKIHPRESYSDVIKRIIEVDCEKKI
jgi:predicted CopG family antitoxin